MPDGGLLVTSTMQGRVFEVDGSGKVCFEFINLYDGEDKQLMVSEALFLPLDYFAQPPACN